MIVYVLDTYGDIFIQIQNSWFTVASSSRTFDNKNKSLIVTCQKGETSLKVFCIL